MHRFNSPPGWPPPPEPGWQPPAGWQPDPSWPPAPTGWKFWVNERGGRSLGPRGTYGSVSRGPLVAGGIVAGVVLLVALVAALPGGSPSGTPSSTKTVTVTVPQAAQPQPTVTVARRVPGPTVRVTVRPPRATVTVTAPRSAPVVQPTETSVYYANCTEARAAGDTPLYVGDPGYGPHLDRDNDGVACE